MNRFTLAAVGAAIVLATTAASADPITIVEDQRHTQALANTTVDLSRKGDALKSTVVTTGAVSSAVTATLTSSLADPMHFSGTGATNISWSTPGLVSLNVADSFFGVRFQLTSPFAYAFTGSFAQSHSPVDPQESGARGAISFAHLAPFRGFTRPPFAIETPPDLQSAVSRTFTGLLLPGEYELVAKASADGGTIGRAASGAEHADFTFSFDLTPAAAPAPTPEPSSLLLLTTGFAGAFGIRYRSRRRAGRP